MRKGFVFAMEEDNQDAVVAEVPAVPETQTEVEDSVAEVVDTSENVEELVVASEEAAEDAETLGEIQEVMAESVEKGEGLDETSAQITEVAVEALCNKLGIKRAQSTIPAMESFGQKSSRVAATRIAMESIGDKIKQIWQAIANAVKKVWDMIKSFALSLVKWRGGLIKHLESIKKKVDGLPANAEAKEKELSGGFAKALSIGKKTDAGTAGRILDSSGEAIKVATSVVAAARDAANKWTGTSVTAAAAAESSNELADKVSAALNNLGKAEGVEAKDGSTFFGNFAGGRSIVLEVATEGDKKTMKLSVESAQKEVADKAAALDKAAMGKLIAEALNVVKNLQAYDKVEKELDGIAKACNSVVASSIKLADKVANNAENEEHSKALRVLASNVREMNNMMAKFGASLPAAIFQGAKSVGDYVNASANNFGAKKEEAKAA